MRLTGLSDPFRKRLDGFAGALSGVEAGDVESLHRARVACRRLRELVPLLALDRDVARNLNRRLRKATRQLGAVRELDVLMLLIRELGDDSRYSAMALEQIGATAAQTGKAARERLAVKLPASKLERLARRLERVLNGLESGEADSNDRGASGKRVWLWALEARLARRAAQVRVAIDAAGAMFVPETLHGVRIAVKKLRYAAELAGEATHRQTAAEIAGLKAAQDLLGRLHDLQVLLVHAREAQAFFSPPDFVAWRSLGSLVHRVEEDCRQLHARYMRDRSGLIAIANRMGALTSDPQEVDQSAAG
jgi:CHAD domain-containing protein